MLHLSINQAALDIFHVDAGELCELPDCYKLTLAFISFLICQAASIRVKLDYLNG